MAQQRPATGFDLSRFSTSTKILLGAGIVALINSFISWWQHAKFCATFLNQSACASASRSALGGDAAWAGVLMFIGLLALIAWEGAYAMGALRNMNLPQPAGKISAYIAGVVVVFGLLKVLLALSHVFIGAFIGLILLIAIAYGAYMRWQEPAAAGPAPGAPPAAPPSGGGFTA